jgi:predicted NUDIX family NTP pyrophosphohydrolase
VPQRSAGILLYRRRAGALEVMLVHPGGPFWAGKDDAAWGIPKGIYEPDEDALAAAKREFAEETGSPVPPGDPAALGAFPQPSGKIVDAWCLEGDFDADSLVSNFCTIEWPQGSGRTLEIPEVDQAAWFTRSEATTKGMKGQRAILDALWQRLGR